MTAKKHSENTERDSTWLKTSISWFYAFRKDVPTTEQDAKVTGAELKLFLNEDTASADGSDLELETTPALSDNSTVLFKSATGWFKATLAVILAYVRTRIFSSVIFTDSDINPAVPFVYYKVDASPSPVTAYVPEPLDVDAGKEYDFELHKDTHKLTIKTVNSTAGKIDGFTSIVVPNEGGRVRLKCISASFGYALVQDTRNMGKRIIVTADRDFTTDGFEHMYTYEIIPAVSGSSLLLTLPPPKSYENGHTIQAKFVLNGNGSATIVRSDGGFIGAKITHLISTTGKGITIEEGDSKYLVVQDSRPSPITNISFPFYRLTDVHSTIPSYYALCTTKNDARYGAEQLLVSPSVSSTTPSVYVSYATDIGLNLGVLPKGKFDFIVNTRKVADVSNNVFAYYTLHKRAVGGTETLIATTDNFIISSTTFAQFSVSVEYPETTFLDGDLLVMKVWIARTGTGGTNPQLQTKIEGESGAYFQETIPSTNAIHNNFAGRTDLDCHPASSISYSETDVADYLDNFTGGATPSGVEGDIQLNDGAGELGADPNFNWNITTKLLGVIGKLQLKAKDGTQQKLIEVVDDSSLEQFSVDSEAIQRLKSAGAIPVAQIGYFTLYYDDTTESYWGESNSNVYKLNVDTIDRQLDVNAGTWLNSDVLAYNAVSGKKENQAAYLDTAFLEFSELQITGTSPFEVELSDSVKGGYSIQSMIVRNNDLVNDTTLVITTATGGGGTSVLTSYTLTAGETKKINITDFANTYFESQNDTPLFATFTNASANPDCDILNWTITNK